MRTTPCVVPATQGQKKGPCPSLAGLGSGSTETHGTSHGPQEAVVEMVVVRVQ